MRYEAVNMLEYGRSRWWDKMACRPDAFTETISAPQGRQVHSEIERAVDLTGLSESK
jgi:hypothetical protein